MDADEAADEAADATAQQGQLLLAVTTELQECLINRVAVKSGMLMLPLV